MKILVEKVDWVVGGYAVDVEVIPRRKESGGVMIRSLSDGAIDRYLY